MPNMHVLRLLPVLTLILGGCVSTSIRDLAVVSVEAVDYHDQAEMPTPSAAGLTGFMTDQQIVEYGLGNPYEERPHRLILKATFTSETNLARFVRDNGYNLGTGAHFCGRENEEVFLSFMDAYWRGINVARPGDDPSNQIDQSGEKPITYYFFLEAVRDKSIRPGSSSEVLFNLRERPEDVCFDLAGGNAPFGFRSNVVTIPKEMITSALQKVPQDFSGQ